MYKSAFGSGVGVDVVVAVGVGVAVAVATTVAVAVGEILGELRGDKDGIMVGDAIVVGVGELSG